ncbi:hypothetical protein DICPUDRAFT_150212 [Dictyostelium purpureum]|uniref:TraB family protein n=1 Tax=Dictyostelium purpureum TaxID=5786 RepID=F0ZFR2_DICPU|nr:uncharacterized protein DICPUDRAFT_150212 [Dictyostelium purpureum]EGC37218.1 hypothetical protein DICPUDRAFT_150212 [Dictyostelium purpureum]|eukprot:XP_003286269.1 hypothetical protein DICPUDRAFT_150212 [Dictyostelium purpureum]
MISIIIRNNRNILKPSSVLLRGYCSKNNGLSTEINDLPIYYHRDLHSNKDIYLIGSIHVSKNSAYQVQKFIQDIKPDTVVLELCEERYQKIKKDLYSQDLSTYEKQEMPKIPFLESLGGGFLPGNFLEMAKRFYKGIRMLGLTPGLEFLFAIKEANKLGANIVLGDTSGRDTIAKVTAAMKSEIMPKQDSYELGKLSQYLGPIFEKLSKDNVTEKELEDEFKKLLNNKTLKEIRTIFEKELPFTYEAILLGRERNMVRSIKQSKGNTIVTVAGALHIDGIKELLNLPLDKIPTPLPPPPQSAINSMLSGLLSGDMNSLNNNNNSNSNSNNNIGNINNLLNNDNIKNMLNNDNFKNMLNNDNFKNMLNNNNNFNNLLNNNNNSSNNNVSNIKNLFGKFLKPKD